METADLHELLVAIAEPHVARSAPGRNPVPPFAECTGHQSTGSDTHRRHSHHQIYLRTLWEFLPDWQLMPQAKWVIGRDRSAGDRRPAVGDYTWVDLTLRRSHILDHLEVAFSVRNLFNVDAREPSQAGVPAAAILHDLPLAGRSFFGEIRFDY